MVKFYSSGLPREISLLSLAICTGLYFDAPVGTVDHVFVKTTVHQREQVAVMTRLSIFECTS